MKRFRILILAMLTITTVVGQVKSAPHANCCLCACGAKDETKCSRMCIRLHHGKKIVEEPQMVQCTAECKRVHVVTVK